jgi:hypothetical protein
MIAPETTFPVELAITVPCILPWSRLPVFESEPERSLLEEVPPQPLAKIIAMRVNKIKIKGGLKFLCIILKKIILSSK